MGQGYAPTAIHDAASVDVFSRSLVYRLLRTPGLIGGSHAARGEAHQETHFLPAKRGTHGCHYRGADRTQLRCVVMAAIDIVWHRIVDYSGEVFHQKHGKSFVYSVSGDTVYLDTIDQNLSRHHIAQALARMPLTDPGEIADLGGASYIYAILTDWRIAGR